MRIGETSARSADDIFDVLGYEFAINMHRDRPGEECAIVSTHFHRVRDTGPRITLECLGNWLAPIDELLHNVKTYVLPPGASVLAFVRAFVHGDGATMISPQDEDAVERGDHEHVVPRDLQEIDAMAEYTLALKRAAEHGIITFRLRERMQRIRFKRDAIAHADHEDTRRVMEQDLAEEMAAMQQETQELHRRLENARQTARAIIADAGALRGTAVDDSDAAAMLDRLYDIM